MPTTQKSPQKHTKATQKVGGSTKKPVTKAMEGGSTKKPAVTKAVGGGKPSIVRAKAPAKTVAKVGGDITIDLDKEFLNKLVKNEGFIKLFNDEFYPCYEKKYTRFSSTCDNIIAEYINTNIETSRLKEYWWVSEKFKEATKSKAQLKLLRTQSIEYIMKKIKLWLSPVVEENEIRDGRSFYKYKFTFYNQTKTQKEQIGIITANTFEYKHIDNNITVYINWVCINKQYRGKRLCKPMFNNAITYLDNKGYKIIKIYPFDDVAKRCYNLDENNSKNYDVFSEDPLISKNLLIINKEHRGDQDLNEYLKKHQLNIETGGSAKKPVTKVVGGGSAKKPVTKVTGGGKSYSC